MTETHVVTVFLRNQGDVLLLRRSDDVGSYPGRWGAVAGHAEGDLDTQARREIEEEAGIEADDVTLVRRGESFAVADETHGTWRVHPYLFDCATRAVEPNWETAEFEWVAPPAILRRETVPDLWTSYARVAPTVETVRADREHGSAFLSVRALEVLRDAAATAVAGASFDRGGVETREPTGWDDLAAVARTLRDARDMAAIRNRVNRVMAEASIERTPTAVEAAAGRGIAAALEADQAAASEAAARIGSDERVVTLSRSGTVLATLRAATPAGVTVAESRPGGEGVGVAETLAAERVTNVTLTVDANLPGAIAAADRVLVGADAVHPDGTVVNKVGTRAAALAAAREDVPLMVVCACDKIHPTDDSFDAGSGDPREVYDGDPDVDVAAPLFEVTPGDLVDRVVTEDGPLDDVADVAAALRTLSDWE